MGFAELTNSDSDIVYTFNTAKVCFVAAKPIDYVHKPGGPELGTLGTFVWGIESGAWVRIDERPEAFLVRVGLSDEFVAFENARCDTDMMKV
jgi:hypothetical protein